MSRRLIVNGDALGELIEAAAQDRPGPRVRAALVDLVRSGTAPAPEPRPWLSVKDAAALFGVSERTVRDHANAGRLPHRRIGRRLLIHHTAVSGAERSQAETPMASGALPGDDAPNDQGETRG